MKKFLIGLFIFGIFAGFSYVHADFIGDTQNAVESVAEKTGDISRGITEFNLKLEYFARPYKEKSLSFEEWLDLYGYTSFGAGAIPTGSFSLPDAEEFGEVGANTNLRSFLLNVTNWVLTFLGLICIIMIIYAGYLCIITGGEDGSEKCKKILIYVAVGIIIILVSYAVVNTILKSTIEGGDNYQNISVSRDAVIGSITSNVGQSYGQVILIDSGAVVTLNAEFPSTYSNLRDLQWNLGGNSIVPSNNGQVGIDTTFFNDGFEDIVTIGIIDETLANGDIVSHDYIARQRILVGDNVIPSFQIVPSTPRVNESIHFDARSSQVLVGMINEFSWDCSPASLCSGFTSVNDNELNAVFDTSGTVTVTLTVTPNIGNPATFSKTFEVESLTTSSSLQAKFIASTLAPIKGNSVHFRGRALPIGIVPDNFTWECLPMGTTNINICTDFNANASGNLDFYSIFSETGNAKISLIVEKNGVTSLPFERVVHVVLPGSVSRPSGVSEINFEAPSAARVTEEISFSARSTNPDYTSFRWTFSNGVQSGEMVTNSFTEIGDKNVKLEALNDGGDVVETLSKNIVVVEQGKPIPSLKLNGETVFQGSVVDILVGENLNFQTNSIDSLGNMGASANIAHSWLLNGSVVDESSLSEITKNTGLYSLKLNAISTLDSNKRSSLQFKIKVLRKSPKVNLVVSESSLGKGFYNMKATVETEGTIQKYKFEVLENRKTVATQVINSAEKVVETVIDISNKIGEHNYIFQVSAIEIDGAIAKKIVNKNVNIEAEEVVNNKPTVEIFTTPSTSGLTSTMFRFYTQADDLDNDFLTYKWEFPNGKKVMGKTVSHRFEKAGNNKIKVIVSDGIAEVESTETIFITEDPNYMNGNNSPVILSSGISPGNTGNLDTVFNFYSSAEDADEDELDYSWIMGDGNRINLQNTSYQYQFPGRYIVKLLISDGLKTVMKSFPIIIVDNGETIPTSTIEDYELTNNVSANTSFAESEVAINSTLTEQNVEEFSRQVETALSNSQEEFNDLLSELTSAQANSLEANIETIAAMTKEERAKFLTELEIEADFDIESLLNKKKEINLMNDINVLLEEYKNTVDPLLKKNLLNKINQKRIELELLNAELQFNFVGMEGTINTKFFFYGKIPQSDRPILIKWDTGDNRTFIGQNVAWKYAKTGDYVVRMEVSDGISTATDTINIKIK